ncbi:MAG: glycosyltransferase family 1 protein [Actinobacteria bacterium]|nr:glycosyltransferase family 1 protein [Actinomycetota bacterium]
MEGRPLRIAFDLSATRLGQAGVARTALQLADALDDRGDVEVLRIGMGSTPAPGTTSRRALALRLDLAWATRGARAEAQSRGADVLHLPLPRGPLSPGRPPTVVTVHDLAVLHYPETLSRWNRTYTQRTLPRVLAAADAIIAVSQNTADDIAAFAPTVAARVHVIPNGVDPFWSAPAEPAPSTAPYVLAVGTPEPRKNLQRLVDAMRLRRVRGSAEELVHVGADGWGDVRLPDEPWLRRTGRVTDTELRALYRGAAAVAIPSLHEGSGLPALEAFAAGAPVAAAAAGALPETCGDAAVLIDPLNVESIAAGIDEAISRRDELIRAGRTRAEQATWANAAERCVELYCSLA